MAFSFLDFFFFKTIYCSTLKHFATNTTLVFIYEINGWQNVQQTKGRRAALKFTNFNRLTIKNYGSEMSNHVKTAHKFNNKPVSLCCVGHITLFFHL